MSRAPAGDSPRAELEAAIGRAMLAEQPALPLLGISAGLSAP